MNAIIKAPPPVSQGASLVPQNLDQAMRLAEMMARGKLVPEHLRNPSDALMVVELAMRFGMSPFAVAQATSVIQGKLMLEGKLVSAAVHSSGILSGRLAYAFTGEGAGRRITVSGTIRGETAARTIEVELKDAKTTNGMWTKQPDQQLVYFATRAWARRHVPEVMLGVYSPEEFDAAPPRDTYQGTTLDHTPAPPARVATPAAPAIDDAIPERVMQAPPPPKPPEVRASPVRKWLDGLQADLATITDEDALHAIENEDAVKDALRNMRNGDLRELKAMLAEAFERVRETPHDPETGELVDESA